MLWKYIFLFWSLYFCQLTAIYCNLLATPLFKSQTVQFIAGGSKVWKQCEAKSCPHRKWLLALPLVWRKSKREEIIKMCFYSCHRWRRWWRRWRLKSVRQLETKTCPERKQGCFQKLGEGLYTTSGREKLFFDGWSNDSWLAIWLDDLCFNVIWQQCIAMCVEIWVQIKTETTNTFLQQFKVVH